MNFASLEFGVFFLVSATRWQFLFDNDCELSVLEGTVGYRQGAGGNFMVLPRLPSLYRCS